MDLDTAAQCPAVDFDTRPRHSKVNGVEPDFARGAFELELDGDLAAEARTIPGVDLDVQGDTDRADARGETPAPIALRALCRQRIGS